MPIYEYQCEQCKELHEENRKIMDRKDLGVCPVCGWVTHFIISAPRIALDGTDAAFPTAWGSWEKKRAEKMRQEQKLSYRETEQT